MKSLTRHFLIASLLLMSACSTIIEGTTQKITVNSEPQGAQCLLRQADEIVGRVTTPGSAVVNKTKNDLVILCSKPGYETTTVDNRSDLSIASLGNAAFYELSFMGNAVDAATGASNKYDSTVLVKMVGATEPAAFPAPPGMPAPQQLPQVAVNAMSMQPAMPGAALTPLPVAPAAPATIAASDNPALHAAMALGRAAQETIAMSARQEEVAQLTYAQEVLEMPRRPPFEITQ